MIKNKTGPRRSNTWCFEVVPISSIVWTAPSSISLLYVHLFRIVVHSRVLFRLFILFFESRLSHASVSHCFYVRSLFLSLSFLIYYLAFSSNIYVRYIFVLYKAENKEVARASACASIKIPLSVFIYFLPLLYVPLPCLAELLTMLVP